MINKNHMEMCRFASKDDDGYEKFLVALRGYIKTIEGKKAERQLAEVAVERERELAESEVETEQREGRLARHHKQVNSNELPDPLPSRPAAAP